MKNKTLHHYLLALLLGLFSVQVAQAQVPNAPTNLVVTPIDTEGRIQFTPPSNIGGSAISNYEYSTDGGTNWITPSPAITASPLIISSGLTNLLRGIFTSMFFKLCSRAPSISMYSSSKTVVF